MNVNKILYYAPLVGFIYLIVLGFKHGFDIRTENISTPWIIVNSMIQAVSIASFLIFV